MALLLQKAPLTKHIHPEYATPLHLACAINSGASARKLLEHGANATVLDAKGRTPLTIALETQRQRRYESERSQIETALDVILRLATPLHILDEDLVAAAELDYKDVKNTLTSLLNSAKGMIVSEATIYHVLNCSHVDSQIIELLMQRSGDIGMTAKMLEAVQSHYNLEKLPKPKPKRPRRR